MVTIPFAALVVLMAEASRCIGGKTKCVKMNETLNQ